eukprot:TRINITY_DN16837_c0_g2_i1.p1 TRINITY_DN16837_c0_g2~~TRINITY_DN16837_c0_g2_i1.p1  ORF type:complete len:367 (+),score=130.50 TRINITY_DN16837_c0_g2_i1:56-1156(+)
MLSSLSQISRIGRSFKPAVVALSKQNFFSGNRQFGNYQDWDDHYVEFGRETRTNLGVRIVPEREMWIVERFGKYKKTLESGLHFFIPFVDSISYVHSLKETTIKMPPQNAITKDNVTVKIDGVLYTKIVDPYKASYGVQDPIYAITQLAMTTMRSELGKISLDASFEERETLNEKIVAAISKASIDWGIECLRYEICDISPPQSVRNAMDMQAEAERRKRAEILESEGSRQSDINTAEGKQQATVLNADAEANAILLKAKATADGIRMVTEQLQSEGSDRAVALRVAEQYMYAFGNIAKEGNTILLPAQANDPGSMVAQALSIFGSIVDNKKAMGSSNKGNNKDSSTKSDDALAGVSLNDVLNYMK